MTAYLAMTEYKDCLEFMDELKNLAALIEENGEVKDDTTILSLSHNDYHRIRSALYHSNSIVCSYKDTIGKTMQNTEMPDTLV